MHILYIHQHFATRSSATGTRSYEMARRLIEAGHRVSMICGTTEANAATFPVGKGVHRFNIDSIDIHCIGERWSNSMGYYRRLATYGAFARIATRVARTIPTDLVFATSTPLSVGIPGMKAARTHKVPFVFEVRDLWPDLPIELGLLKNPLLRNYARRLERRIYSAADHIITLSPGMSEGVQRQGIPTSAISMIPNGCDLDLFRPTNSRLDDNRFGSPEDLRFVFAGAHGIANGLDAVLDAAKVLKRRGERGVRFVFIGNGALRERLIQRSRQDQTDSYMTWLPFTAKQELAYLLPKMDVGMMILKNIPGFYDGTSPNKFFDYLASGLPVLCNYPGWISDLVREYDCGVVAPPDDPESFAESMLQLRDQHRRFDMGLRARELAESTFARDQLAEKFTHILEATAGQTDRQLTKTIASKSTRNMRTAQP